MTTDSQGDAGTTLYLAGMLANPQASSNQTVELQAKAPDPSSVSLVLPVVESSTVTGLNPISKITLPAHLFVDAANLSKGASYRTPFGVVYLPTSSSSPASLPLSLSVIGLASGNVTSEGPIQPMPAWLNVWFADGEGNKITSLNLPRYNIEFIFLTSNTTMALPPNTMNSYYVAIQVQEGGTSFTEAVNIVVQGAISTGGPAQTTG